ncbi:MAG: hypothetical protein A2Z64_03810 [Betaproteobacteria bacterium RIFCSPLOWO2_02_67_12]|nr:MAG: hypothetical protein A2Z64_03810 [Betaproteobacteria bacterium RIFCSPLOWO2_02_67_12]OGA26644.1 MAG: hypothetical protein A3I65_04475 [Betaproteobacteria bacterium RIFCSPLOWO2_02_FULL_68_150]
MMRARLIELRERRQRLAARAQLEREQLAVQLARADVALAWLERGRSALEAVRRRPLVLAAAAALILALRPRRTLRLLAGGWSLWQLYRRAQSWWERIAPPVQKPAGRAT